MSILSQDKITNTSATWNGSAFEVSQSVTVPTGTNLVLVVAASTNSTFTTATFGGSALTQEVRQDGGDVHGTRILSLQSPTEGANTLSIARASGFQFAGYVFCLSETTVRTTGTDTGYDTAYSTAIAVEVGDLVLSIVNTEIATSTAIGGDQTIVEDDSIFNTDHHYTLTKSTASTTSTTHSYTLSEGVFGCMSMIAVYGSAAPSASIDVDIPSDINLKWDTTHQLAVTHDGGTTTLDNVTLSAPTGWETVVFTTAPDEASTESFYEKAKTDATLGGGGYTMVAGDVLAWTTSTGLTIDGQTIPVVDPAATVTGSYKIWDDTLSTWSSTSTYTINDLGVNTGGGDVPLYSITPLIQWVKENGTGDTTTEKLLNYLKSNGATQGSMTELMYEFLKANSSKLDHTERYWDVSKAIEEGSGGFPYTLPITL